jgi:cytoskeleton protein RodZ
MASNRSPRGGTRHTFGPAPWRRRPPREAPATFGETLRQARRARNLSLEDVERETRIPGKYLAALEDQEYAALPTLVYARGVLRAYARFLDLDPEPLLAQFRPTRARDEGGAIRPALPLAPSGPPLSWSLLVVLLVALGAALLTGYLHTQYAALDDSLQAPERPATAGGLDVPEPLIAPWTPLPRPTLPPLFVAVPSPAEAPAAVAEAPEPAETPGPGTPTALPQPTVTSTPPPSPTPPPLPRAAIVVEARVTERCYLQVWSDGRQVVAETVEPGTNRTFTANDRLQMRVSNAGAVQVLVNGEPQGRLGTPGQAIDVTWGRR